MVATPLRYLTLRILKMKVRNPGTCITCQEVFNILIYGLIMGFALIGLRSPRNVPLAPSPLPEFLWPALHPCGKVVEYPSKNIAAAQNFTSLLFAPDTALSRQVVASAAAALALSTTVPAQPDANCPVAGFATTRDLLKAYREQPSLQKHAAAAILFNGAADTPQSIGNFTIAMSRGALAFLGESGQRDYSWPAPDAYELAYLGKNDGPNDWQNSGFVSVQAAVSRSIAAVLPGAHPTMLDTAVVKVARFPLQPSASTFAEGATIVLFLLPLFAAVPPITFALFLAQQMVVEKGCQLPEGLRMMGMRCALPNNPVPLLGNPRAAE